MVVGAGPAGLEAARVLGERGHEVVVLEAADVPGGQVRLAAAAARRRDLVGIVEWRVSEAKHSGVEFRYGVFADAATVLAERPDVVVVATGGLPNTSFLDEGEHLVTDTWDVMSGAAHPQGRVLVYDDNGAEPALDAAELLAVRGAAVELVTPERTVGPDVGEHELAGVPAGVRRARRHPHPRATADRRASRPTAAGWWRVLRSDYTDRRARAAPSTTSWWSTARCRTTSSTSTWCRTPATAAPSTTPALLAVRPQTDRQPTPTARFQLFRIGDAVASRNIHAAVYDALRLCSAI